MRDTKVMDHETDKIHIMPVAHSWEVELQSGQAVTREPSVEQAIHSAQDLAREQGVNTIILHDGDGVTEEIPVLDSIPSKPNQKS